MVRFGKVLLGIGLAAAIAAVAVIPVRSQTALQALVPMWSSLYGDINVGNTVLQSGVRQLALTDAKTDTGVALAATTSAGNFFVARTAGTSLRLTAEATGVGAKTDKVLWEFSLSPTYVAGSPISFTVNASIAGGGTLTPASTTLTVNAYTEAANGAETSITGITAAQQFVAAAANYTFVIPGAGLVPNQRVVVEVTMLVTASAGTATGSINNASAVM